MELHLKDKSVVVTGGGTGIGREIAKEFACEGAKVSICGRRLDRLEFVCSELQKEGLDCDCYSIDVSDFEAMHRMADQIAEKTGGIDVWINNAGVARSNSLLEYTKEDYDYIMGINLESVYEGCRTAAKHMVRQGRGGVIINASSFASKIPSVDTAIYAASKAAVSSFTRSFAAALAPYGIRVCGYIPGVISTEINASYIDKQTANNIPHIPLRQVAGPKSLAKPVVFLASDACYYITGVELEISGGKFAVQNSWVAWEMAGKL